MSLSDFLVPSPLLVPASSLDSLSPLVLSSSSALPPPQSPCGSSASPQASPPPAWCCDESLAALRPSRPMSPPRPVGPPTPLRLCIPSSPPRPICPRTPLGSLVLPDKPRSVVSQPPPRTSGSPAVPRPSTPSASRAPPSLWFPCRACSLHRRPGQLCPRLRLSHASLALHLGLPGL